jgi:DNA-binding NtrC family response regulator
MRLLLVDDEGGLRMTLAANLELDGFDVTMADSGKQALELFRQEPFDLVLSDIRMPGMNGVELFREIKAVKPECPVILMTAFAVEGLVQDAIHEGVYTVLPKPFDIDHVVGALTRASRSPVVLVVDGDAKVAEETASALRVHGIRAARARAVDEALEVIAKGAVDVSVIDLDLEQTRATELMAKIKQLDASIAHIAVAGHEEPTTVREAAKSGMFVCLSKPVDTNALIDVIAKARARRVGA